MLPRMMGTSARPHPLERGPQGLEVGVGRRAHAPAERSGVFAGDHVVDHFTARGLHRGNPLPDPGEWVLQTSPGSVRRASARAVP